VTDEEFNEFEWMIQKKKTKSTLNNLQAIEEEPPVLHDDMETGVLLRIKMDDISPRYGLE
jgi:hypothetical protein